MLRTAADPQARTDGVQQVHARSQVPQLKQVPEVGTRGIHGYLLRYFPAADGRGHGVGAVSPGQASGVKEKRHGWGFASAAGRLSPSALSLASVPHYMT